jgi:hypothetical protein
MKNRVLQMRIIKKSKSNNTNQGGFYEDDENCIKYGSDRIIDFSLWWG